MVWRVNYMDSFVHIRELHIKVRRLWNEQDTAPLTP